MAVRKNASSAAAGPRPPLAGLRVVDFTSAVVGPYGTQVLADHGAEVIKVEEKSGDVIRWISGQSRTPGMSGKFMHMNRNKRSISLDLKQASGREAVMPLIGTADVFLHNMRTAAAERPGLASDRLRGQFAASGNIPLPGSPQALDPLVKDERVAYARLIKESGITAD